MAIAIRGAFGEESVRAEETRVENFLFEDEMGVDFLIRPNIPCAGTRQKSELGDVTDLTATG
jgi:hypothetical protein